MIYPNNTILIYIYKLVVEVVVGFKTVKPTHPQFINRIIPKNKVYN